LAQVAVVFDERASDTQTNRTRLPRHSAAVNGGEDVELVDGFCQDQWGFDLRPECFGAEELFECEMVDGDRPTARAKKHAGGRCLAATGSVILNYCHVTRPRALKVSVPRADDPDRRTLSICGTSPRPSSSWAACRVQRLPPASPACVDGPDARVPRAGRLRSRCADGRS